MEPALHYVSALVAYDGTGYHGFQYQSNAPSIQGALEMALDACAERSGRVIGAGRTDAGVHATGQVIAVRVRWRHSLTDLQRAWNAHLPPAVVVRRVREAPEGFHPRFSAVSRTYRYTVQWYRPEDGRAAPQRSPLTDRFALFETRPLDVEAMNRAAALLVGRHDFASFGQAPQGENTERTLLAARWQLVSVTPAALGPYPGQRLVFSVTADAFLRQMVRNLVGTLLAVGRGEWTPEDVQAALAACERSRSAPPVPPQGLVLEKVTYPAELERSVHGNISNDH
ncbi:MAG: tRNA pseudouridine(38-40) synthase TruA [Caldilineaceae bacterium]|nr:tRNA pseudouridine(38-40) synthase TruA [Caldilineaceae bacterium]